MVKELCTYKHRIGYWKGSGEAKQFQPLTNFALKFKKFVKAPEQLPNYAGFMVKVIQPKGETTVEGLVILFSCCYDSINFCRSCFLPWYHINNSDQLCTNLGSAIPSSVLSCKLSTSQIKDLLMKKWEA